MDLLDIDVHKVRVLPNQVRHQRGVPRYLQLRELLLDQDSLYEGVLQGRAEAIYNLLHRDQVEVLHQDWLEDMDRQGLVNSYLPFDSFNRNDFSHLMILCHASDAVTTLL